MRKQFLFRIKKKLNKQDQKKKICLKEYKPKIAEIIDIKLSI